MKIGFQTIVWGPRVRSIEYMLDVIAGAGYEGVEFFQRPEVLRSVKQILRLLEKRHLTLIGLSGGSLRERMDFCGHFRPEYLYVDTWKEDEACEAMAAGFTLGLHPHAYMPVGDLASAREILEKHPSEEYPELKFVPDTAHLKVTHDDPVDAIRKTRDRIVAIHLKDWSPEFGRSSHRYARGFVELGAGSVDLDAIINSLKEMNYDGWLVVEQDYTLTHPDASTLAGASWLAKKGILSEPLREMKLQVGLRGSEGRWTCPNKKEVLFSRQIARARLQKIDEWYDSIATAFRKLVPCKLVEVWASSPAQDFMSLLAVKPDTMASLRTFVPQRREVLSGITMERKAITHFDLTDEESAARFEHPELVGKLGLKKMVSLPIFNPWNFNHVRLIVNLLPSYDKLELNDDELFRFSANVAFALDAAVEDMCSACATKVNFEAGRCAGVKDFLNSLVSIVMPTIHCRNVALFLVDGVGETMELRASSEEAIEKFVGSGESYRRGEALLGKVWESKETLLSPDSLSEKGWKESSQKKACLFVPFTKSTAEVIGVARCHTKSTARRLGRSKAFLFSDEDTSILEAIVQAAIPHLELVVSQERRVEALGKLTHELDGPLVAITAVADYIKRTTNLKLEYDYIGDICSWCELMGRLIDNVDLVRFCSGTLQIKPTKTYMMRDVVASAVRQTTLLLRERNFSKSKIRYGAFGQVPPLWIDRNMFQQVMFNLLSNSIKYCFSDPKTFRVEITGSRSENKFVISFRDWGPGIPDGLEKRIFDEGFRGPDSIEKDVSGQGLGLWMVRRIIQAHEGSIEVTNNRFPTEFTIELPEKLDRRYLQLQQPH